jgi:hypothetical protein
MAIDFGDDGFDYTRELCNAIEAFTQHATRHRSKALSYRGMQLRYAIERQLYIQGINSPWLFNRYLVLQGKGASSSSHQQTSEIESELVQFLHDATGISPAADLKKPRSSIYQMARRAYGWLRSQARANKSPSDLQKGEILIHVGNAKFATYLTPITARLGKKSYSYLTCDNPDLAKMLERSGVPVRQWTGSAISIHTVFCSPPLSPFLQLMHEADQIFQALQTLRPCAVVVVEGNAPKDIITSEACRLLDIPCICIQQGWSPYVHSGFRNMNFTEMLVWGNQFAELLAPFNPHQKFRVTGSHAMETASDEADGQAEHSQRVFSVFLQAPCALLGVRAFDAFVDLIEISAKKHSSIDFVVREHPGYPLPQEAKSRLIQLQNISFSIPGKQDLADLIRKSELVISVFSTVLIEALAVNVVPLICSIGPMKQYSPDLAGMGAALEVNSITQASDLIDEIVASPDRLARLHDKLPAISEEFFKNQKPTQEIADILLALSDH